MEYGKFASAEELLKGYVELEKSFTQKCQELAAAKQGAAKDKDGTSAVASPSTERATSTTVDSADTVPAVGGTDTPASVHGPAPLSNLQETTLQQYEASDTNASEVLHEEPLSPPMPEIMAGGGNVSMALPSRPKTIKEASLMAKELFKMG